MHKSYVFGYGSLVNAGTHDYRDIQAARLSGWRRRWRHVPGRQVAFLTVVEAPGTVIDGVVAEVQARDWAALDIREAGYLRAADVPVSHQLGAGASVSVYHAPDGLHEELTEPLPILLSYLDVIVQGFQAIGGPEAVAGFFATTDGWDAPVLDDRTVPRYPRHQVLSADEQALTDWCLAEVGARVVAG